MFQKYLSEEGEKSSLPFSGNFMVLENKEFSNGFTTELPLQDMIITFKETHISLRTLEPPDELEINIKEVLFCGNNDEKYYRIICEEDVPILLFPGAIPELNLPVLVTIEENDTAVILSLQKTLLYK